jgi:hypothetical protein
MPEPASFPQVTHPTADSTGFGCPNIYYAL